MRVGADAMGAIKTYIDIAYGVHSDMRSHTGGGITFGTGTITSKSSKQKLNVKSSPEGEVIGMSDYVAFPIWLRYFLQEQGYDVNENIVYQDNQSAMKIEMNGKQSCGQKSRHIKSRYFFIKDRINKSEIKVENCPTEKMLADFFTKPLQGELLRRFRDVIMGHKHISTPMSMDLTKSTPKERVEENTSTTIMNQTRTTKGIEGNSKNKSYAEVVRGKWRNDNNRVAIDLIQLK